MNMLWYYGTIISMKSFQRPVKFEIGSWTCLMTTSVYNEDKMS